MQPGWQLGLYLASLIALPFVAMGAIVVALLVIVIRERRARISRAKADGEKV